MTNNKKPIGIIGHVRTCPIWKLQRLLFFGHLTSIDDKNAKNMDAHRWVPIPLLKNLC